MITLQNADAALKEYYLDAVTQQLNEGVSPFLSAIEKSTRYVYGKNAKCALIKGDMSRIVTCDEDGDLPAASGNTYYDITMPLKNIYGTISITDKAIRASQESSGAFINLLNAEMEGLVADAKSNFSRMLFGDGNGLLAYITAAKNTTTFTLTSVKSWYKGMVVDIASAEGTSAAVSGLKITAVDTSANTITVSPAVSNQSNYVGYPVVITNSYGKELTGLSAIFDGATVYGHTKADDDFFSPYVAATSELTEEDIIAAIEAIEEQSGGKVGMILCSHSVRNKIASLFRNMRSSARPKLLPATPRYMSTTFPSMPTDFVRATGYTF